MKLVHVTSSPVRKSAGVREVVLGLAQQQRAQGLDVSVLGLDHPDWATEKHEWDGIPTTVTPVKGPRAFGYSPDMARVLREMDPDVVHLHGLWMHPGRSVLQWHRATGKPFILSPHGMLSEVALSYGRRKKQAVSWLFQDAVFRHASVLHATSEAEEQEFRNYGLHGTVSIVPNGISDLDNPLKGEHPGRTILSLGRIHKKKALDHLIRAWQTLEADFPEWNLLIVGPDELGEAEKLANMIRDAGLERAEVREPVYGAEKIRLMASAGVFALPTRSENFALTVAESLILGVPVVSSMGAPWAGLETEKCGRWVPIGAEHMANALREVMGSSDTERMQMGARGRAWMLRDFSWPSVAAKLQHCYAEAISTSQ